MSEHAAIAMRHCSVKGRNAVIMQDFSWQFEDGQTWLVIGPNGGGKDAFLSALSGEYAIVPQTDGFYRNAYAESTTAVSLEAAARLIQEERSRDESEYIEGGVDHGRSGRAFICEVMGGPSKPHTPLPEFAARIETMPQVKLCGVEKILDRGLKYMSTGEIRRTLLCRALLSGKRLLLLSDPFAGLDAESRTILREFFATIAGKTAPAFPRIMLFMERYTEIPGTVSHVLELTQNCVSFCGTRAEYETLLAQRAESERAQKETERAAFINELNALYAEGGIAVQRPQAGVPLVEMHDVNVGWDGHHVLQNLSWTLFPGEHWLIRGPNGSGKTTFLELITGDNMQVFSNDVRLFGKRRGSGETIWDIKKQLGIVSYRLHVEYRMVGGTDLEAVLLSGFHDSIGLYQQRSEVEQQIARKWLRLGGFEGRERESFASLSYGEQRAVLILRAAVKCPPVLILDEPCHGLDEENRARILALMETVAQSGATTLLHVTHDPSEALSCERHILELHPGKTPMYRIQESQSM